MFAQNFVLLPKTFNFGRKFSFVGFLTKNRNFRQKIAISTKIEVFDKHFGPKSFVEKFQIWSKILVLHKIYVFEIFDQKSKF